MYFIKIILFYLSFFENLKKNFYSIWVWFFIRRYFFYERPQVGQHEMGDGPFLRIDQC